MPDDCELLFRLPRDTVMPDFGAGGLYGLIRAIAAFLDGAPWVAPSGAPVPRTLQPAAPVVVFVLVDGLGDAFLLRHGQGSRLLAGRTGRITSVFPSTTASAMTTVLTGLAPAEHGLTGWFIRDDRFGGIIAPLPLTLRAGGPVDGDETVRGLFPYPTLFMGRARPSVMVSPHYIAGSAFSRRHCRGARIVAYKGLDGMVDAVADAATALSASGGGYIHAYYPDFDALSHETGCESDAVIEAFWHIDFAMERLACRLAPLQAHMLVSADHGFIDSPEAHLIDLDDHPDAVAMLDGPLSGERRAAFVDVRAGAEREFSAFFDAVLGDKAVLLRSADLLERGMLGPGPRHPRIGERMGSHTLLMQPGWTIRDRLAGEKVHQMIGVHGGLSSQEMWVPLVCMQA